MTKPLVPPWSTYELYDAKELVKNIKQVDIEHRFKLADINAKYIAEQNDRHKRLNMIMERYSHLVYQVALHFDRVPTDVNGYPKNFKYSTCGDDGITLHFVDTKFTMSWDHILDIKFDVPEELEYEYGTKLRV